MKTLYTYLHDVDNYQKIKIEYENGEFTFYFAFEGFYDEISEDDMWVGISRGISDWESRYGESFGLTAEEYIQDLKDTVMEKEDDVLEPTKRT